MSDRATTTSVAQAVSRAVDEHQEFGGHEDDSLGLYLDDGYGMEGTALHVSEVSAELENAANGLMSQFTVKTSDGQEWSVRITPKPAAVAPSYPDARMADPTQDFSKFDAHGNPR